MNKTTTKTKKMGKWSGVYGGELAH